MATHDTAFDDDLRDACLAWAEAGCPRGGRELVEVERATLALERNILAAEDTAGVMRRVDYQIASIEAEKAG